MQSNCSDSHILLSTLYSLANVILQLHITLLKVRNYSNNTDHKSGHAYVGVNKYMYIHTAQ